MKLSRRKGTHSFRLRDQVFGMKYGIAKRLWLAIAPHFYLSPFLSVLLSGLNGGDFQKLIAISGRMAIASVAYYKLTVFPDP